MALRIKGPKDFWAGLIFALFGGAFVAGAWRFPMGTAQEMGSAYFPTIVAAMLVLLGIFLVARSLALEGAPVGSIALKPLLMVLGALAAFGALVAPAGLVAAVVAVVFLSAAGGHEFRLREVLVLTVVLVALAVGIFHFGLGMSIKLWPSA